MLLRRHRQVKDEAPAPSNTPKSPPAKPVNKGGKQKDKE